MRTVEDLVRQEVIVCVSALVSAIASGYDGSASDPLGELCEKAAELYYSPEDWVSAARDAGAHIHRCPDTGDFVANDGENLTAPYSTEEEAARAYCEEMGIDPHVREILEHWAVTEWLAEKLAAGGERVDRDFEGLCIWGRTTSGQAIAQDEIIQEIHREAAERFASL